MYGKYEGERKQLLFINRLREHLNLKWPFCLYNALVREWAGFSSGLIYLFFIKIWLLNL